MWYTHIYSIVCIYNIFQLHLLKSNQTLWSYITHTCKIVQFNIVWPIFQVLRWVICNIIQKVRQYANKMSTNPYWLVTHMHTHTYTNPHIQLQPKFRSAFYTPKSKRDFEQNEWARWLYSLTRWRVRLHINFPNQAEGSPRTAAAINECCRMKETKRK